MRGARVKSGPGGVSGPLPADLYPALARGARGWHAKYPLFTARRYLYDRDDVDLTISEGVLQVSGAGLRLQVVINSQLASKHTPETNAELFTLPISSFYDKWGAIYNPDHNIVRINFWINQQKG